MLGISVKKVDSDIVIRWQLSKVIIPTSSIVKVTTGDTQGGDEKHAIRIGLPYGTTDRVVIITNENTYVLFTTNYIAIQEKLNTYLSLQR